MQETVFCSGCGTEINARADVCPKCGVKNHTAKHKDRMIAAGLALLLGGLGAHKFYLNQPGMGIIYFIFCWTFIPALIAAIEGILYLCMSDADFSHKYN